MAFTHIELFALENPYEQLSDGDALATHAKMLNKLGNKEQVNLATRIIAACPETKFKQYANHIKALGSPTQDKDSFHSVLTEAYQVRQRITSLLDSRNKAPHSLFIGKEFNPAPFHRFSALAQRVMQGNEVAIAERLALSVPESERSQLAHNLSITFPKQALAEKIQLALMMRRNIETLLLSDDPQKFFTSRDYNEDTCKAFVNMFRILLKGKEETIGTKLGTIESENKRSLIKSNLELLHTEAYDETNPFKMIADSLSAKEDAEEKRFKSQATNPNGYFNSKTPSAPVNIKLVFQDELETPSNEEDKKEVQSEEEEEHNLQSSVFGTRF